MNKKTPEQYTSRLDVYYPGLLFNKRCFIFLITNLPGLRWFFSNCRLSIANISIASDFKQRLLLSKHLACKPKKLKQYGTGMDL
jgi:hypothetical protein